MASESKCLLSESLWIIYLLEIFKILVCEQLFWGKNLEITIFAYYSAKGSWDWNREVNFFFLILENRVLFSLEILYLCRGDKSPAQLFTNTIQLHYIKDAACLSLF